MKNGKPPNPRFQRTRLRSPLNRKPFGGMEFLSGI